ncbi:MAG: MaoC family dehydratase [Cytophagales bacterium]|nr:MAG: MaoC family dehydratase [Cytophagales bacterium]
MIEQGTTYQHPFSFSQTEVEQFAAVTGDKNPIHIDKEYAAKTIFKQPIMHGFLGGSVFSKIFGTLFPGEGTIYLKQTMEFKKPMLADEKYEAVCTAIAVDKEKHKATMETKIIHIASQQVVLIGEAIVMNKEKI